MGLIGVANRWKLGGMVRRCIKMAVSKVGGTWLIVVVLVLVMN